MNTGTGKQKEQRSNTFEKPALETLLCQMQIPEAPALNEQKEKKTEPSPTSGIVLQRKKKEEISRIP